MLLEINHIWFNVIEQLVEALAKRPVTCNDEVRPYCCAANGCATAAAFFT